MPSTVPTVDSFYDAKAKFLAKVRNAKATGGIIDNGREMEEELIELIQMGDTVGLASTPSAFAEFIVISELLAEDTDARISEERWRERMATLGSNSAPTNATPRTRIPVANSQRLPPSSNVAPLSPVPEESIVEQGPSEQLIKTQPVPSQSSNSDGTSNAVGRSDKFGPHVSSGEGEGEGEVSVPPPEEEQAPATSSPSNTSALLPAAPSAPPSIQPQGHPGKEGNSTNSGATTLKATTAVAATGGNATSAPVGAGQTSGASRPKVAGKSLELLQPPKKRVTLQVKRKQEDEYDDDDDDDESEKTASEMEVDNVHKSGRSQRKTKKRRRVVSAEIVNSDGEEQLPEEEGWPTVPSRRTCEACAIVGRECRFYKIQPRGRQRYACQWCKCLKKGCSDKVARQREVAAILAATRLAMLKKRAKQGNDEEEDEMDDLEGEDDGPSHGTHVEERPRKTKKREASKKGQRKANRNQERPQAQQQLRRSDRHPQGRPSEQKKKDEGDGEEGSQAPKKNKGKGKAQVKEEVEEDMELDTSTLPTKMDVDDIEWQTVERNRPGPSSGVVRRRTNPGSKQIAEIYARLSNVENRTNMIEDVTTVRFRELQQDVDRLDSNSETQKKFMGQELARIELQTQSAVDRTQTQIESLRQQTADMHISLSSIHQHSETLTEGLKATMESMRDLRFDLPNAFDEWMRMREGRGSGTVSGAELQPWNASRHTTLPSLPNLPPLHVTPPPPAAAAAAATATATATAFHRDAPSGVVGAADTQPRSAGANSGSAPNSPADAYPPYMVPDLQGHSDAMLDLHTNLDHEDNRRMDVDEEGMDFEGNKVPDSEDVQRMPLASAGGNMIGGEENVEMVSDMVNAKQIGSGASGVQEAELQPNAQSRSNSVAAPNSMEAETGQEVTLEGQDGITREDVVVPPAVDHPASPPLSPSQRTPPSTPPTIIREQSVQPPAGLLVSSSLEVLPPSSQPSIPPRSPQPDFRLLNAPPSRPIQQAPPNGGNQFTGRVTRSRSGSVTNGVDTGRPSTRKGGRNGSAVRR